MSHRFPRALIPVLAGILLAGCSMTLAAPPPAGDVRFRTQAVPTPTPALPPASLSLKTGQAIFRERCAACHGPLGGGDGPQAATLRARFPDARLDLMQDFAARTASLWDWFQLVSEGRPERGMPPWETTLSTAERWAVVLYTWSLAVPPEARASAPQRYQEACAACHGEDGRAGTASLADPERLLRAAPVAWIEALRPEQVPAHAGLPELAPEIRQALIAYLPDLAFAVTDREAREPPRPIGAAEVRGQVLYGATEAPAPGVTVTLYALIESSPIFSQTVRTAADGSFRFPEAPVYAEADYLPVAEWQEIAYPAALPITLTAGQTLTVTLTVFDRTADPGGIHIDQAHWILQPLADRLLVTEIWIYSNRGSTTYGGANGPGMLFFLPSGASNLQISEGELGVRYRQEGERLIDTAAVPPGIGYQTAFGYELPLAQARTLTLRSLYPVAQWSLLIAGDVIGATGPGIRDLGVRTLGATVYRLYEVRPPDPGQALTLSLRPRSAAPSWLAPILLILGAGLAAGIVWVRWGRQVDPTEEIARLDEAYAAGEVDEATYRRRRAALKARAMRRMGVERIGVE
ncbi:MAG: c-type cytochrome [Thermoflexus sp.]|jgi:mono/diheme cytochrome c family protein|nr:c-type cytochrome [Thermoflexus sp.]